MGYSPRGHKESGTTERLITNEIRTFTPVTNGNPVMGFPPIESCVHACVHVCVLAQVCIRRVYVFVTHVCK